MTKKFLKKTFVKIEPLNQSTAKAMLQTRHSTEFERF